MSIFLFAVCFLVLTHSPHRRRYAFPLRAGHKAAHLCTESTVYRYIDNLDTPKKWFKANVDAILALYGAQYQYRLSKEDLHLGKYLRRNLSYTIYSRTTSRLVIGTLEAQEYALFVSHEHPDSQVEFNVFSATRTGQPWGEFTFSSDLSASFQGVGPKYDEEMVGSPQYSKKISTYGNNGRWDSVLVARLRFKPDQAEPTAR